MGKNNRIRQMCSLSDGRQAHSGGLCLMHHKRLLNHGSTESLRKQKPLGLSVSEWFTSRLDKSGECWLWTGPVLKRGGYGVMWDGEKKIRAHHYLIGKPSPGMEYDHLCRNILCVRPEHLELVSPRENRLRQWANMRSKT